MKTLYNTVQQCESILNPDLDQVMDRMTTAADDAIRKRIREYCTYDPFSRLNNHRWGAASPRMRIIRIDKDEKGWYVDTERSNLTCIMDNCESESYYNYCASKGYKIDEQKGFLIEDIGVYFRWRKHEGGLMIGRSNNLVSTEGLPDELDLLCLNNCCKSSGKFEVRNKIKVIELEGASAIKISGNGCKNVIVDPRREAFVIGPRGVKIYRPRDVDELLRMTRKLC